MRTDAPYRKAMSLVAACCAWPRADAGLAVLRRAADGIDWDLFVRLLARHRVWALAHEGLRAAGVVPPLNVAHTLAQRAAAIMRENLMLTVEAKRLSAGFSALGLRAIYLKGTTLAQLAYGGAALKHGRDIDLYVNPAELIGLCDVLLSLGYACSDLIWTLPVPVRARALAYWRHIEFRHPQRGCVVEVHTAVDANPHLRAWSTPEPEVQSVCVAGRVWLPTLGGRALLCYLALHGTHHAWFRLKWLADFHALLQGLPVAEWGRLIDESRACNADIALATGVLLCAEYFGYSLSPEVSVWARGNWRARMLAAFSRRMMAFGDGLTDPERTAFGSTYLIASHFLIGRGFGFVFRQLHVVFFSLEDWLMLPLPPALTFLYPVLRLPLWCSRRIARAVRAIRKRPHSSGARP